MDWIKTGVAVLGLSLSISVFAATKPAPVAVKKNTAVASGDPVAGKAKAEAERCLECHGEDGHGTAHSTGGSEGKFPKLAGQWPDYLLKQFRSFRSGERKDDMMSTMAKSVEDADALDIFAFFHAQRPMAGDGKGETLRAKKLYLEGEPDRGIPACASCHGVDGRGGRAGTVVSPVIAGQEWRYLEKQLIDWRSGQRKNSPGDVMSNASKNLSDEDIRLLTDYLAGAGAAQP